MSLCFKDLPNLSQARKFHDITENFTQDFEHCINILSVHAGMIGDRRQAAIHYSRAFLSFPSDEIVIMNLANAYLDIGLLEQAIGLFELLVEMGGKYADTARNILRDLRGD